MYVNYGLSLRNTCTFSSLRMSSLIGWMYEVMPGNDDLKRIFDNSCLLKTRNHHSTRTPVHAQAQTMYSILQSSIGIEGNSQLDSD